MTNQGIDAERPIDRVVKIAYHYNDDVIHEEPMIFKRLYAIGQSLVINGECYEVIDRAMDDGVQHVKLEVAETCDKCGGIVGKRSGESRCVCP